MPVVGSWSMVGVRVCRLVVSLALCPLRERMSPHRRVRPATSLPTTDQSTSTTSPHTLTPTMLQLPTTGMRTLSPTMLQLHTQSTTSRHTHPMPNLHTHLHTPMLPTMQ